jgi:hypothetical protein
MRWRLRYWVQDPLGEVCNLLIKKNNILKKKRRKEIEPFVEFLVYLLYTSTIHGPLCFFKEICLLRKKKKKKKKEGKETMVVSIVWTCVILSLFCCLLAFMINNFLLGHTEFPLVR